MENRHLLIEKGNATPPNGAASSDRIIYLKDLKKTWLIRSFESRYEKKRKHNKVQRRVIFILS
jgi:hypothetical protein